MEYTGNVEVRSMRTNHDLCLVWFLWPRNHSNHRVQAEIARLKDEVNKTKRLQRLSDPNKELQAFQRDTKLRGFMWQVGCIWKVFEETIGTLRMQLY